MNPLDQTIFTPYRNSIEQSQQPTVNITLQPSESLSVWQSKIGGTPYLPLDAIYPRNEAGMPLAFLAQINFAEIPPLPHFPTQGILQFYIDADDDLWGLDFDQPISQRGFRVIYFTDIITHQQQLHHDIITYTTFDPNRLPFSGQYAMQFQSGIQYISYDDHRFALTHEQTGETIHLHNFWDKLKLADDFFEAYHTNFSAEGHRIGGYPFFTQSDPREYSTAWADYILLLQLDSDEAQGVDMLWGDAGVCNFFIHPHDLAKRDFSKVLYNWDCC